MSEWKECTIADLGTIITGKTPATKNKLFWDGKIPFVTPKDIQIEKHIFFTERYVTDLGLYEVKGSILPKGAVCVSCIGNIGYVGITTQKCVSNQQINSIIVNESNDIDFVFYLIKSLWRYFKNYEGQSTALSILNKTQFSQIRVPYFDLDIQRKIASILSSIDNKIELNNMINKNLEQQAQAIFKSWFVDFEPFGGVMPEDWKTGTFADIIKSTLGGDWGKEMPAGNYTERVYCIRGADIPAVKSGNKGKMPTRYILPKNFSNKKLMANDIVVEISGGSPTQSTGRVVAISQSLLDCYDSGIICTNFCRAIKPCTGYSNFIYYYWQYLYDRKVFFSYENGTTGIKNLDISGFIETEPIIIPNVQALEQFNSIVDSYYSRIFENGHENENLSALRDNLLPKLMNGKIDVSKVQI